MRKVVACAGVLLLALPVLAFAQVKMQTHAGEWGGPGAVGAYEPGFRTPVKAGDFTLNFLGQIEVDFEWRTNYDFNNKAIDGTRIGGPTFTGAAGEQCKNISVNFAEPFNCSAGGTRVKDFIEQETRWGMDAVSGPFKFHILLEQEELWDRDGDGNASRFHIERGWGGYDFGIFEFRAGLMWHTLEPARMVYSDDDWGVRLLKDYGNWGWSIFYTKRQEDDNASLGALSGSRSRDQDIIMASVEFAFANPMGPGTFSVVPFYLYHGDKRLQAAGLGTAVAAAGLGTAGIDGDIRQHIVGGVLKGNIGPVRSVIEGVYTFGHDGTGLNSMNKSTLAFQETDIRAWFIYGEFAYPVPNTPLTVSIGAFVASGDDDPFDKKGSAYTSMFHDTEIFSPEGIWADDDQVIRFAGCDAFDATGFKCTSVEPSASLDAFFGGPMGPTTLTGDDDFLPTGISAVSNVGFNIPGLQPGTGILPGGTLTRLQGAGVGRNFSHPGIQYYNLGIDYDFTKELTFNVDVAYIRFMTGKYLHPTNTVADLASPFGEVPDNLDKEIGWEVGFGAIWRPHKNFRITPVISILIPQDGIKELVGADDTAVNAMVETLWVF